MKIESDFAILDIKRGRAAVRYRVEGSDSPIRIPVIIHGRITGVYTRELDMGSNG